MAWCFGQRGVVPHPTIPFHKLFSLMLVRRSLGKPLACWVLRVARGTYACPVLAGGEPFPAFTPPRERKVEFMLQNNSSSCQKLAAPSVSPLPASQGLEPKALPGSGSPQQPPEGQGLVRDEPADPSALGASSTCCGGSHFQAAN